MTRLALAGDTMLGRGVAERLAADPHAELFTDEVLEAAHEADALVLNLECCISTRGEPWPDPFKPFFFRAPPAAIGALAALGTSCVTLANNHALDFGTEALLDTLAHLDAAGISVTGAGADRDQAREPAIVTAGGTRLAVVGVSDHPRAFAAGPDRPGIAFADLASGIPAWLPDAVARTDADATLVTPHWGPNMAAARLRELGADLVAGHSAHVFHGVAGPVLYDLGDFLDDYAVDPRLRNDLGLLFLVDLDAGRPVRLEAVPLHLGFCRTRLARGDERVWIERRFRTACGALGTEVEVEDGRLVVALGESTDAGRGSARLFDASGEEER